MNLLKQEETKAAKESSKQLTELNKKYDKLKKKLNFLINFDSNSSVSI